MARVLVMFPPRQGEREVVAEILGDEAAWLVDDTDPASAEVALTFWPQRELREAGLTWAKLPALRLIQATTAGINHVGWRDIPPHVQVAAAPGATGPFVAEYVLAGVLAWARGLLRSTRDIAAGRFDVGAPAKAVRELSVGVVGFGGIGREVARLLAGLGATVRAVSRSGRAPSGATAHLTWLGTMDRFEELVRASDVVVLCLPYTRETDRLVDDGVLSWMEEGERLLVNVARGPLVVEDALYDWLREAPERRTAVLDVWWHYPRDGPGHPYHRPFHTFPNVIMTPHNAPNVAGYRKAMIGQAARQVRHYLETGEALQVHDPAWYETSMSGDERV